ncbi:MAG: TMEM175 family protein [Enterococcus sp.]
MNKTRIEAFTDAVLAIIMTIMILEIHVPETPTLSGLFAEKYYFIAYLISFFYICTAWYYHHYVFSKIKWVSKRSFWANSFWLLCTSVIPVATAWVSEFPQERIPEYTYFGTYILWAAAYYLLVTFLYRDNHLFKEKKESQEFYTFMKRHGVIDLILVIGGLIGIYFFPLTGLIISALQVLLWMLFVPKDSDRLDY